MIFMRYKGRAKKIPTNKRHKEAPKGSSITPYKPYFMNSEDAPSTVSEPNQVANKAEVLNKSGSLRPARIKSFAFLTIPEAKNPMVRVNKRYRITKRSSKSGKIIFETKNIFFFIKTGIP